ncbi:MAG: galactose mutarotase [Atopobiaceae bacterium]|nr:galactose mutarotase [Atopobiaceae bacterium]
MSVHALDFGTTRTGQPVHLYRLKNASGMEVDVTDLGASIVAARVPNSNGELVDVALGFDEPERYENNTHAMGGIVGRVAGRIADASFELEGRTFELTANEGANTLHGGCDLWYERLWEGAMVGRKGDRRRSTSADTVIFGLFSPDGDQGFPGDVDVRVTYRLTDANELVIIYDAQPSLTTLINLTNHAYWNLNGHDDGEVLGHLLHVAAERYAPAGPLHIPSGRKVNVGGTPFDFRLPKAIGRDLSGRITNYDHTLLLGSDGKQRKVATLTGEKSCIVMDVYTDLPSIQVYTAQKLMVEGAKDGAAYRPYGGVALETQYVPDAIHHTVFKQPVFSPEHPFHSSTTYAFSTL